MPVITNRQGLSECWVQAVLKDEHSHDGFASITELLNPPQMLALKRRHDKEIVVDVASRIWALFGKAMHEILRQAADPANTVVEQRFYVTVLGQKIGLQPDRLEKLSPQESMKYWETGIPTNKPLWRLKDFKVTRAWAVKSALEHGKREWNEQVNLYKLCLASQGFTIVEHEIEACVRDWDWKEVAFRKTPFYPEQEVVIITVEAWESEFAKQFLEERVRMHLAVQNLTDEDLPECSVEDRWGTPDEYVVQKIGSDRMLPKSACMSYADAEAFRLARKDADECEVKFRQGESPRCRYCDGREFCVQYNTKINPIF